jgi:hypothetical protein
VKLKQSTKIHEANQLVLGSCGASEVSIFIMQERQKFAGAPKIRLHSFCFMFMFYPGVL